MELNNIGTSEGEHIILGQSLFGKFSYQIQIIKMVC
jgi:hypothetical protein